jgi:hypothetical protein
MRQKASRIEQKLEMATVVRSPAEPGFEIFRPLRGRAWRVVWRAECGRERFRIMFCNDRERFCFLIIERLLVNRCRSFIRRRSFFGVAEPDTMRIDQELDFLLTEGLALASEAAAKQQAKRGEWRERSKNWKKRLRVVRKLIKKKYGGRI